MLVGLGLMPRVGMLVEAVFAGVFVIVELLAVFVRMGMAMVVLVGVAVHMAVLVGVLAEAGMFVFVLVFVSMLVGMLVMVLMVALHKNLLLA